MRLRWTRPALAHLGEIAEYIERENPRAASRVVRIIREQVAALVANPCIGRSGRINDTRELVISHLPYIAVYRQAGDTVEVLAVIHTSRRWPVHLA